MSGIAEIPMVDVLAERFNRKFDELGSAGRKVALFILENRDAALACTAVELGDLTKTSDATVIRTIQTLGFAGLRELRDAARSSVDIISYAHNMDRTLDELARADAHAIDAVLDAHGHALAGLGGAEFRTRLLEATRLLAGRQRIVLFGIGPSGKLVEYVAMLLARSGLRCRCITGTGSALADELLELDANDGLVMLSYGECYPEARAVIDEAQRLGAPVVLVTDDPAHGLSKQVAMSLVIARGHRGRVSLHAGTLVGLEALALALAAHAPEEARKSHQRLAEARRKLAGGRRAA